MITTFLSTGEILRKYSTFSGSLHNAYYFRDSQLTFRCFFKGNCPISSESDGPKWCRNEEKTPIETLEIFYSGNYSYLALLQITEPHVQLDFLFIFLKLIIALLMTAGIPNFISGA